MEKTVLSFYCDDTNPYDAPPGALGVFLDFCAANGVRGESSVILSYGWSEHGSLCRLAEQAQRDFIAQARRAYECGIDTHFELMTHNGLFDFESHREPVGVQHEGVWLYEPQVTVAAYQEYFGSILSEGEKLGIRYTGMTWPGCGCPACEGRYEALRQMGVTEPNPNLWQALLNLAQAGRFRGRTVPCFFGGALDQAEARLVAGSGGFGVFDLPPNGDDQLALWLNTPQRCDPDYYISPDGQSGRLVELVRAGAPYALFFAHWQGLNPANGLGWAAFTRVVERVQRYLGDQVVWMRPSEYTDTLVNA